MPEGDTIHSVAAKLRPVLLGRVLTSCETDLAAADTWQLVGREVARIEARGKHLLIHCAPRVTVAQPDPRRPEQQPVAIWTHLGMHGKWRIGPRASVDLSIPGRAGRRSHLALHTDTHVAACLRPEILRFLGPRGLLRAPELAALGPDLLDPDADLDEAVRRLQALGDVELGDAIMRQSAVAGIGNVYKSELLFLERGDPFAPVARWSAVELRALLERGRELMRINLERSGPRRTRIGARAIDSDVALATSPELDRRGRVWVYERSGRPCLVCGTTIVMRRQGRLARSTYACPRCQKIGQDSGSG